MKTLRSLLFAAGVSMLLFGCEGAAGPQGAPGPQGATGANGNNGVANINIQVFTVPSTSWTVTTSGPVYYYATASDGSITDPVQEEVAVSFSASSATGPWQPLAASNIFNSSDQLTFGWTTNQVTFYYDFSSLTNVPSNVYFNVAVIPPAIMKRHPGTNWKDVSAVLALPEVKAAMQAAGQKN